MDIVDMDFVPYRFKPEFVCFAITYPALYAAASHPHREPIRIVIPTRSIFAFTKWHSTKLSAPNDQRGIEQAALGER